MSDPLYKKELLRLAANAFDVRTVRLGQPVQVEQLAVDLVEYDVVVLVEGILADSVRPEIGVDVVPVGTGAADRHHDVAELILGIDGAQ